MPEFLENLILVPFSIVKLYPGNLNYFVHNVISRWNYNLIFSNIKSEKSSKNFFILLFLIIFLFDLNLVKSILILLFLILMLI